MDRDPSTVADETIDSQIERWSDDGGSAAFVFEGRTVTYAELARRAGSVAAGLVAAGIEPGSGDRVAFCGLNRLELFEVLLACARLGAVLSPINNRLAPPEVAHQLADSQPAAILTTDGFDRLVGQALAVVDRSAWPSVPVDGPAGPVVRDLDRAPFDDRPAPDRSGRPDHPVLMVYTSGTTGNPKGAVLTQRAVAYTCANGIDHQGLTAHDRVVAPLPTFHVGGIAVQTLPTLIAGGTVILHRRFDPGEVLDSLVANRATQTLLVPAMLAAIANHPRFDEADLDALIGINSGSSIVPDAAMAPFFARGIPVGQVYGTTETGPTSVVLRYGEAADHLGSCGRPARHSELRVVDERGAEVGAGTVGEVLLRGPNLFSGYWRNEKATADAFTPDGWYRTGDLGHRDDDGYLHISDRLTDLVISGGENVYPAQVEAVLAEHPAIAEVAVIGRPDPRWGEAPVAVVVPHDGSAVELAELQRWCEGRLARFKSPRELVVVDELPRTALGKVRKHVLRQQLGSG